MANVTATDRMKDDPRFDTAGVLMGVEGDLVRFRMIRLWSWQTEHYTPETPTYIVSRVALVGMFKRADAPEALVAADLVEECPGGFYIRGTEGVIEWLWKKKAAGAKGYAEKAKRGSAQGVPKQTLGNTGSGAQVVSSPCDPGSEIRDPEEIREREADPATPALVLVPSGPDLPAKPDPIADLWAEQERLRAESIPGSRRLALTADRRKKIAALLKSGHTTDDLRACLQAYAAEARTNGGEWFNGESNWVAANVARTLGRIGTTTRVPTTGRPRALGQVPASLATRLDGDQVL